MNSNAPEGLPPSGLIKQLLGGPMVANLLYVAAELGIADFLADGPLTAEELALRARAAPDRLQRVLRALSLFNIFKATPDGYDLTPAGNLLRENAPGSMRTQIRFQAHPVAQKAFSNMIAGVRSDTVIPFDDALGMDFFAYLNSHPDLGELFNRFMGNVTANVAHAVVDAYDFASVRTIVDAGGGNGELIRTILKRYQQAKGKIVDAPLLKDQAELKIRLDGLQERCEFVEGDFFKSLPVTADLYLLKSVIHDWDDANAVRILQTCRNAMSPTSVLLVVEGIVNSDKPSLDVIMGDIIMLTMAPGKERTIPEFEMLFHQAGLQLLQTIKTSAAPTLLKVTAS